MRGAPTRDAPLALSDPRFSLSISGPALVLDCSTALVWATPSLRHARSDGVMEMEAYADGAAKLNKSIIGVVVPQDLH